MKCAYCATGMMQLFGNLTMAKILEQMMYANHILEQNVLSTWAGQKAKTTRFGMQPCVFYHGHGRTLGKLQQCCQGLSGLLRP
jgi:hypothetical protein